MELKELQEFVSSDFVEGLEEVLAMYRVQAPTFRTKKHLRCGAYYCFDDKMITLAEPLLYDDDLPTVLVHEMSHHIASVVYNELVYHDRRFTYVLLNIIKAVDIPYNWNIEYKKVLKEKRTLERIGAI